MNGKPIEWGCRKALAAVLALITLLTCASCGNGTETKDPQSTQPPRQTQQEGSENPLNTIPTVDMDRDIVVLSANACGDWIIEDAGEPIGYAIPRTS